MLAESEAWVYLVELVVAAGCLVAAVGAFRAGLKLIALALLIAALAAIVHSGIAFLP
ncbi:MAG: hypothetical protein ACJ758_08675 [Actinomycetota bacterium]